MSKISLKPNVNGTADFTIESPDSNTDRTLTLPDEAGTVLTTATDLEPQVKDSLNATGSAPVYACRAWVNFDGTGTVSIRESGNVSSITDNGTGDYTVNFATAMPDNDYAIGTYIGSATVVSFSNRAYGSFTKSVGSCRVIAGFISSTVGNLSAQDQPAIDLIFLR